MKYKLNASLMGRGSRNLEGQRTSIKQAPSLAKSEYKEPTAAGQAQGVKWNEKGGQWIWRCRWEISA